MRIYRISSTLGACNFRGWMVCPSEGTLKESSVNNSGITTSGTLKHLKTKQLVNINQLE
jgi:hypothetical protein